MPRQVTETPKNSVFFTPSANQNEQHYVYYKDLIRYHPKAGRYAYVTAKRLADRLYKENHNAEYIRNMAQVELNKEQALLSKHFNTTANFDLTTQDGIRDLITAINNELGIKEVFERNLAIMQAGYEKDSFSYVGAKLMSLLQSDDYYKKIVKAFNKNADPKPQITKIVTDAVFEAINAYVFDDDNTGPGSIRKNFDQYKNAYESLRPLLNQNNGAFTQRINQIYQIPELVEAISALLPTNFKQNFTSLTKGRSGINQLAIQGGLLLEDIVKATLEQTLKNKNIQGDSIVIGDKNQRTDTLLTIGIDSTNIVNKINQATVHNRAEAQRLYQDIEETLRANDNEGFIVYTSEKNYNLKNTKGYQAGSQLTLSGYEDLMSDMGNNIINGFDEFIGAIINTAKGAMLESQQSTISAYIARDIGKFLFDDWTIEYGKELANSTSKVQSIHLMNLNGIYIPISVILFKLADAIDAEDNSTYKQSRIASASISTPQLLYYNENATRKNQWYRRAYKRDGVTQPEAWQKQARMAYDNTKIRIHFLKDFRAMMNDLYGGQQ